MYTKTLSTITISFFCLWLCSTKCHSSLELTTEDNVMNAARQPLIEMTGHAINIEDQMNDEEQQALKIAHARNDQQKGWKEWLSKESILVECFEKYTCVSIVATSLSFVGLLIDNHLRGHLGETGLEVVSYVIGASFGALYMTGLSKIFENCDGPFNRFLRRWAPSIGTIAGCVGTYYAPSYKFDIPWDALSPITPINNGSVPIFPSDSYGP